MIPEDLERQISLAEVEVSEEGARPLCPFLGGFFGFSLLEVSLISLLDLCAHLPYGLK